MKEVTIQIPDGKRAEWINGVLALVDESKVDNHPVTERIKTFEDACAELGDGHELVIAYNEACNKIVSFGEDVFVYLRLRIIVAALNEGWEPKFEKGEKRYFPWFWLYTQDEYDMLDDEKKRRCILRPGRNTNSYTCSGYCIASNDASRLYAGNGSRLALRTRELAAYAGSQFAEEWADFMFKPGRMR